MDRAERHALRRAAKSKPCGLRVGRAGLSEGFLEQLRSALRSHGLVKVRLEALDGEEADAQCRRIAEVIACEWVSRTGRVGTFYLAGSEAHGDPRAEPL